MRVCDGSIFDVAVDLRMSSKTFGQWVGRVLTEHASVLYKTTDYCNPKSEYCIRWDDPTLDIDWPKNDLSPILSTKDSSGLSWLNSPKIS